MKHVRKVTQAPAPAILGAYQPGGLLFCAKKAYIEVLFDGTLDIFNPPAFGGGRSCGEPS